MKTHINNAHAIIALLTLVSFSFLTANTVLAADDAQDSGTTIRNAYEVSYENAEDAITQALTEKGVADKVSAFINGRKSKPIFASDKPVSIEVRGLKYDKQNGHWDASLIFIADGDVVSAIPSSGHFDQMLEVAVLKHEMRNSDIISANDIEVRDFSVNHTRSDTITDISELVGKSPLRTISPYRPIRSNEVVNPIAMKKDTLVQMHYSMPGMEISTTGEAMSAGAIGDVINVRNTTSKKIVRAVVASSDSVNIVSENQLTSEVSGDLHAN